jgi:predicted RNA-binding Zn ribbon-like protein
MESNLSAPGRLETVRKFINTKDVESGADKLADPEGLAAWLTDAGLLGEAPDVTAEELRLSVEVREALRSLAASNHGMPPNAASVDVLNDAARAAGLQLSFTSGGAGIESSAPGVLGGLGRLLSFVADAMNDGTWTRLKVCMNEECAWAFYDHARNRSAKWCDMSVCGNRMKARAYRARRTVGTR